MNSFSEFEHEAPRRRPIAGPKSPVAPLEGHLDTMQFGPTKCAVYCSKQALTVPEADVLVYAHGLLNVQGCIVDHLPEGFVTDGPFRLGRSIDKAVRPIVLIVPLFDWSEKVPALGDPDRLNQLIDYVLEHIGSLRGMPLAASELILAAHSRGHSFLDAIVRGSVRRPSRQGALAKLSEVWMFDSTYSVNVADWTELLRSRPGLKISVFYLNNTSTEPGALKLQSSVPAGKGRITVTALDNVGHCEIPASRLPVLLKAVRSGAGSSMELEAPTEAKTLRERIVEIAESEWLAWRKGSIKENEAAAGPLLKRYWDAVDPNTYHRPEEPWSAAFVSYVIKKAGPPQGAFTYSSNHTVYIMAAKKANREAGKFQAFPIAQAVLEPGDIVCHGRDKLCNVTLDQLERGTSHGEIVVEVGRDYAITIGGNTSDTVGKNKIKLDEHGHVDSRGRKCPFFVVLKYVPRVAEESKLELPPPQRWSRLKYSPGEFELDRLPY